MASAIAPVILLPVVVPLIAKAFGHKGELPVEIGSLVKAFDWSTMNVADSKRNEYLHETLAPSYGTLTSESIKAMDKELKIMIAGTMRALAAIPEGQRNWDKILSTMMQNPLIEPDGTAHVARNDRFIKAGINVFKFDGSPDAGIVKQVQNWFNALIADDDVVKSTKIDINILANIVAQTGATVDAFATVFYKDERHEQTLVDIGVLRFPDTDKPYFKLYRIQLTAWSQSQRVLMVQDDQNGITGEYNARNFRPRKAIIDGLKADVMKKAIQEAENLFG